MKFYHEFGSNSVVLNDVHIPVPRGVKYVTVNKNDIVQGWSDEPYTQDGRWYCHDCIPIRIGWVEFEFGDDRPFEALKVNV